MTDLATHTSDADVLSAENRQLAAANTELQDQVTATRQLLADTVAYHDNWRDTLVASAHEYARDNDLCGRFDDFMDEHGLPRRDIALRITFTLTIPHQDSEDRTAIFEALNADTMNWEEDDD